MEKKRIDFIDTGKGIGIFLVVWGHLLPKCFLRQWIYTFHMPLFFVLSGVVLCMSDKTLGMGQVKKRIRGLLIPYFLSSALYLVAYEWPINGESLTGLVYMAYQTVCFRGMAPMWFLASLFWGELGLLCLRKTGKAVQVVVFLLLFSAQVFIFSRVDLENVSGVISNPVLFLMRTSYCLLFLMAGAWLWKGLRWITDRIPKRAVLLCLGIVLLCLTGIAVKAVDLRINLHLYRISDPAAFLPVGVGGAFAILLVAKAMDRIRLIKDWGNHSLAIMVLHYPFTVLIQNQAWWMELPAAVSVLAAFGIAVVMTVMASCAGRWIARYIPFAVGKTKKAESVPKEPTP